MDVSASKNRSRLIEALERIDVHDHLCLIYETQEEQFAAVAPFIRSGLERGEKCIYITDDNTASEVLDALRAEGIDVDSSIKSGALTIADKQEAYLKQGRFDPDWMIRFLQEATNSAKAEGFSALRVTGEMTWALGGDPGVERLMEYESKLNRFFPVNDALAICQYNRKRFSPEVIAEVISTHPLVIFNGLVCKNHYYVPPEEFLEPTRKSLEVERVLSRIFEREQRETELEKSKGELEETVTKLLEEITQRERAEEALREWASFAELNPAPVLRSGPDGKITNANPAAYQVFGKDGLESKLIGELLPCMSGVDLGGFIREGRTSTDCDVRVGEEDFQFVCCGVPGPGVVHIYGSDITERKRAEGELEGSHERFLTVMDSLDALVYVADMETYEILFVNQYGHEIFGDLVGETCWQRLQVGQTGPCAFCSNDKLLTAEGEPAGVYEWEFQNTLNDRWYEIRDRAIRWVDGRLVRLEIALDVTERKRAEEEQALQRRRLEALWEISRIVDADFETLCERILIEALAMTDSRYAFYGFLNEDESVMTLYSWSREALEECRVRDKPIEYPIEQAGIWGDAVRERKVLIVNDYEADHPSKKGLPEGHVPLTRILAVPIFTDGRIKALVAVANKPTDYSREDARQIDAFAFNVQVIIEHKRAEEEVAALKALNENVVQSMQEGLVALDRDFRVTLWSETMEEISGYAAEEVLGRVIYDAFPHLLEQGVDKIQKAALAGEAVERFNVPYQTPEDEVRFTNERFAPLRDHMGEIIGVLAVVEDVTELLQLEQHVASLQEEIRERRLIDIAKGILMRERGLTISESHNFILKKSRDERVKAGEIARQLIVLMGTPEERKKFAKRISE